MVILLPGISIALVGSCFGQTETSDGGHVQHDMPGMQMPTRQQQEQSSVSQKPQSELSVPDLLKEAMDRPALSLSDLETLAIRNNPTLRQTNDEIQRSAGQATQAGLYPNPSVGYQGEQIRGGSYSGGEQGAFVQQTIVLGGKLGLRRQVYRTQQRENEMGMKEQRERVIGDVDRLFYAALAAQEAVKIREDSLRLAADAAQTAHQLANVGQADAPDVLQAEVEAEQAQIEYIAAQRMFIQDFRQLSNASGNPQLLLSPLQGNLEKIPTVDVDHVIEDTLKNSPAVGKAQQTIVIAEAKLKSAKREAVPDITLRAGLQNSYEPIGPLNRPVGLQGFGTGTITLPIFNRNQGNVRAARAELDTAQAELNRVRLSLRETAEPMLQNYLADEAQVKRYRDEIIPRAWRAYQLYLERYRAMAAAYPQVLISQRTLLQLRIGYVQALRNLWTNTVALQHFTLSGGLESIGRSR
jgi:cobalt-zinc-cadmium efflux system outer membrane protein